MIQKNKEAEKLLKDMDEKELRNYLSMNLSLLKSVATPDTFDHLVVIFRDDAISHCGTTIDPAIVPSALRNLADQLEREMLN